jgi:hypothetical protein
MNWGSLDTEFSAWRDAELTLPFWWRDDDAVAHTPELEQLNVLSLKVNIPVHVAVIPADFCDDLKPYLGSNANLIPVVHGFGHENHAFDGAKKCEFPSSRDLEDGVKALEVGYETLSKAFDRLLKPLFVPPWNRFDDKFLQALQGIGYKGFSTFTPRAKKWTCVGVEQVNTHVDPIDWRGSRSLADVEGVLRHTVRTLRDRRLGVTDNDEPFGFLTHHLVHDEAIWNFSEEFLQRFAAGPIRIWTADELGKG